jgi:hypothetical protein
MPIKSLAILLLALVVVLVLDALLWNRPLGPAVGIAGGIWALVSVLVLLLRALERRKRVIKPSFTIEQLIGQALTDLQDNDIFDNPYDDIPDLFDSALIALADWKRDFPNSSYQAAAQEALTELQRGLQGLDEYYAAKRVGNMLVYLFPAPVIDVEAKPVTAQ